MTTPAGSAAVRPVEDRSSNGPARRATEEEPLLGRPGADAYEDTTLTYNWVQGTAPLAQVGGLILVVIVWASVFTHPLLVFSGHPLFNSLAILFAIEAVLILQPTGQYNPTAKKQAAYIHASFAALAAVSFYSALAIIIWHKQHNHIPHFESYHSKFGAATYALILLQALVGFTQLFVPQIYGGVDNARAMYKYHRFFGYALILPLLLVTITLATRTYYGGHILNIKTWAVVITSVAIVAGVYPRIQRSKVNIF